MTPFSNHNPVSQHHEPRIASNNGFKCGGLSEEERILRTSEVLPVKYILLRTGSKAAKGEVAVVTEFIDAVYISEILVVCGF